MLDTRYLSNPAGLSEILEKVSRRMSSNHKRTTHRLVWSLCTDYVASYLKHIAGEYPGVGYEHIAPADIEMEMRRDESAELCPILPVDTFRPDFSHAYYAKPGGADPVFTTELLDSGLNTVSVKTPLPVTDAQAVFLRSAFDKALCPIEASIENRRLHLLNFNTDLPNRNAFAAYFNGWRQQQINSGVNGMPSETQSLFFEGDITLFRFVNSISGYDQGTDLIKRVGMHVLRYSKRLASEHDGMDWYFANPHGDEFMWVYHGLGPSDASAVVKGMREYLFDHPLFIKRSDTGATVEMPLILTMGWAPLRAADGYDFVKARADAHNHLMMHKREDHMLAETLYPESRNYNRRNDDAHAVDL